MKKKKPQHKMGNSTKRFTNVSGIYAYNGKWDIKGKNILLVDDIVTTGATVNECAKMLIKAGANEVYCLSATIKG